MALLTTGDRAIARAVGVVPTIWTGMPRSGTYLRPGDLPMLLIGGVFIAFGLFFSRVTLAPANAARSGPFPLFFVVVWLSLALSQTILPFVFATLARARTYYALTSDGYALVVTNFIGTRVKRVYLPALSNIQLDLHGDGTGTVTFGTPPSGWFVNRGWGAAPLPPAFEHIPDAPKVYERCAQLQRKT